MSNAFYVVTSRKITNAMETAADRTISKRVVTWKALCIMTLAPYGWSILLAGEEEPNVWLLFLIG